MLKLLSAHPADLGEELTSSWKTQLDDYEIIQPIEQLDISVIELAEKDIAGKKIIRYSDKYISVGKMNSAAKKYEFIRGEVLDGGSFFATILLINFLIFMFTLMLMICIWGRILKNK